MARRMARRTARPVRAGYGYGFGSAWMMGLCLFLFGLIKYLGYEWEYSFMAIGILIILKSLILCRN